MSEADTELVLAMVDVAAQAVAPDEHRESFADYARLLRSTRTLPSTSYAGDGEGSAEAAAGAIDLKVGLPLLGHLGGRLLAVAAEQAQLNRLVDASGLARDLLRRRDQDGIEALAERTVDATKVPAGTDRAVLVHVVLVQINVLGATQAAGPDEV